MEEIWKDIPNYEGEYQVSNLGRIKSLSRQVNCNGGYKLINERILRQSLNRDGYFIINLGKGKHKTKSIHQLVAIAFLGHAPCGLALQVNHIDGNKTNNNVSNLEIVTARYNTADAFLRRETSSKYTGVHWKRNRQKWCAAIKINGKKRSLGFFKNEIDAANAYLVALHELN